MKMNKLSSIILLIIAFQMLFISSCNNYCNCKINPYYDMVNEYDLKKSIIKINSTNLSTAFETIFLESSIDLLANSDSINKAHFCQAVVNPISFFNDESGYFFIESNKAWMIAHATKPELVGTYRYDIQDVNGKFYVRDMIETINYKGNGFVDYYFDHPQTGISTKKLSFVKDIPAANFFIGSGFYQYAENKYYTSEQSVLLTVESLTKSMAEGLSGGFSFLSDSMDYILLSREFIDHIRFFDNTSGYFFIYDFNCNNIAHGIQKDLQGQNLYNYQDTKGNYVIRELVTVAKNDGSGYYEYYWNNPLTGKEEQKKAFVYKIPGIEYFVGSGVYY